jgi:hypothetical protein
LDLEVFGFGGIADTEYSVLVETNYSAEYSSETDIQSTTTTIDPTPEELVAPDPDPI